MERGVPAARFLQYNDAFEILLWPDLIRHAGDLDGGYGSIWLRKVG